MLTDIAARNAPTLDQTPEKPKPKPIAKKRICHIIAGQAGGIVEVEVNSDETEVTLRLVAGPVRLQREQWDLLCSLKYEFELKEGTPIVPPTQEEEYPF